MNPHIQVPILEYRLRRGGGSPRISSPVDRTQACAAYSALLDQRRLGHLMNERQCIECAPAVLWESPDSIRAVIKTLKGLGFAGHHINALFITLRQDTAAVCDLLSLPSAILCQRWGNLASLLGLQGPPLAGLLSYHPLLLLTDSEQIAASAAWLNDMLGWEKDTLRLGLKSWGSDLLLQPAAALHDTAAFLQQALDLSLDELHALLRCAPCLLAMTHEEVEAAVRKHPASYLVASAALEQHPPQASTKHLPTAHSATKQLNVLYLLSKGTTVAEVVKMVEGKPTVLRHPLWPEANLNAS